MGLLEFQVDKRKVHNIERYSQDELDITYDFAKKVHKELEGFIKCLVLFGSIAREKRSKSQIGKGEGIEKSIGKESGKRDIDILLVVDDVSMKLSKELVQTYRVIVENIIRNTSDRLHVITLKFSSFWEYVRAGDPVAVNILRDGVSILDTGFFEPLQVLLYQGRIRPSPESVFTYFNKAPNSLKSAGWHVLQAVLDMYWAVIDSAHAALMKLGEVPPSPEHVADILEKKLIKPGIIEPKYAKIMRSFYKLMKDITHGYVKEISGKDYDQLFKEAESFVREMEKFINK